MKYFGLTAVGEPLEKTKWTTHPLAKILIMLLQGICPEYIILLLLIEDAM